MQLLKCEFDDQGEWTAIDLILSEPETILLLDPIESPREEAKSKAGKTTFAAELAKELKV